MTNDEGLRGGDRRFRFYVRAFVIGLCLFVYLVLGFYTELKLIGVKPLPEKLIEDFQYYKRAYADARKIGDPYRERDIGIAFLYPPPALLVVGLFARLSPFLLRASVLITTNILLLMLMIYGVAHRYGYSLAEVWWWFPLGLGFAPFLELVHLGQINVVAQFGVFLMFLLGESAPVLGGLGLALGTITKVTPLAFIGYLLANRNLKAIAGAVAGLAGLSLLTGLMYGWQPFVTFADVFQGLLEAFPLGPASQSLFALLESHTAIAYEDLQTIHQALTAYMLLVFAVSAIIAYLSREREPLFIVLSLGLTLIPNVMWYHHYVFFLLPIFVWLAWRRLHPAVVVWCIVGLSLIQVDRLYSFLEVTHGLLAHAFGHLSILFVLAWQVRQAYSLLRSEPDFRRRLKWRLL
jgi:hypothetical protein